MIYHIPKKFMLFMFIDLVGVVDLIKKGVGISIVKNTDIKDMSFFVSLKNEKALYNSSIVL